jgi:hypothetical protein
MCVSCTGHVPRDVVVMGNTDLEARPGEPHSTLSPSQAIFSADDNISCAHLGFVLLKSRRV